MLIWNENIRSIETEILLSVVVYQHYADHHDLLAFALWFFSASTPAEMLLQALSQPTSRETIIAQHPILATFTAGESVAAFKAAHGSHFLIERFHNEND